MPLSTTTSCSSQGKVKSTQPSSKTFKRDFNLVSPNSPENQVSLANIRTLLKEEIGPLQNELEELKSAVQFNSDKLVELSSLDKKVSKLEEENTRLQRNLERSAKKWQDMEEKLLSMDVLTRRNNLKFFNVQSNPNETQQSDCMSMIINLCRSNRINVTTDDIEQAHMVGHPDKKSRALLVKFVCYKVRQRVFLQRQAFKESGVTVVQDFPPEIVNRRKFFYPTLQAARQHPDKYKATLVTDKLLLNGRIYSAKDCSKLPDELNPEKLHTIKKGDMIAFFTCHSILSNHFKCSFEENGLPFTSVEQYLMMNKATHFGDKDSADAVMKSSDPVTAKAIGKKVKGFQTNSWIEVCNSLMLAGVKAKFSQNADLATYLKSTGKSILVEANPNDSYWGVGLALSDKDIWNSSKWKGKNELGKILMEVRDCL